MYGLLRSTGYYAWRDGIAPYATVLTFHRVNDRDQNSLTVHPSVFEDLLTVLSREYHIISMTEVLAVLTEDNSFKPRTIAITFDDGYLDNYSIAAPILKQRKIPATFFVTSGYIGTERRFPWDTKNSVSHPMMAWDHVRQLADEGFDIGAHSVNHVNLGNCSPEIAREEIFNCKRQIEDHLGREIAGFAYPFGGPDCMTESSAKAVQEAGFAYSCSNYGGKVIGLSDRYNVQRTGVYPTTTEMLMEIDEFMTYYNGLMRLHFLGATLPFGYCSKPGEDA